MEAGDGVTGRIVVHRLGEVGNWVVQNSTLETNVAGLELKQGDVVDVIVDCRSGPEQDMFSWRPVLFQVERRPRRSERPALSAIDALSIFPGSISRLQEAAMNEKTGKLLSKYARETKKNPKELKRWWNGLPWTARRKERARMQNELDRAS